LWFGVLWRHIEKDMRTEWMLQNLPHRNLADSLIPVHLDNEVVLCQYLKMTIKEHCLMVHLSDSVNIYMAFTTIIISYTHSAMVNQYPDTAIFYHCKMCIHCRVICLKWLQMLMHINLQSCSYVRGNQSDLIFAKHDRPPLKHIL
jgi:hypothetical protein